MTTLYRKYRGQKVEEIDLAEVRESLEKIVESGKIPHALLFSGPKGTGKTSAARILAKVINCEENEKKLKEPCNKCGQCVSITKGINIDVIELDAASHRGIDDVRALRDAVGLSPARARKKVYIIDEAHMLTTEASNALLKTLEEPPEHVVFILATTNPEKLIETIRSRTTNIIFRKAKLDEIVRSLGRPVKGEKIKIDKESLEVVAKKSDGSFRDAIKILEQLISEKKKLDTKSIEEFLFNRQTINLDSFLTSLAKKEAKSALEEVENVIAKGGSMETLLEALSARFRAALLYKIGVEGEDLADFSKEDLVYLIELLTKARNELKTAFMEQLPVEMVIVEWCESKGIQEQSVRLGLNSPVAKSGNDPARFGSRASAEGGHSTLHSTSQDLAQTIDPGAHRQAPVSLKEKVVAGEEVSEEVWKTILAHIKPINTSIEALLRAAKPLGYDGKSLTLGVFYKFHKERLEEISHRQILEGVVAQVMGGPVRVICVLTEPPVKKIVEEKKPASPAGGEEPVLTEGGDKDIIKVAEEIFGN